MNYKKYLVALMIGGGAVFLTTTYIMDAKSESLLEPKKGCVFKSLFGEENIDSNFIYKTPQNVMKSLTRGLTWIEKAQHNDGGWGAGSHANQGNMNPHTVKADPATTSMVVMALLRTGSTLDSGKHATQIKKGLNFLIWEVENTPENRTNITALTGTQIQTKLGANIDVVLSAQCFSNVLDYLDDGDELKAKVEKCLDICVSKIQKTQSTNGSFSGGSWAGVLQSSLANNALESAMDKGAEVDTVVLEKSREYQKSNYDVSSGTTSATATDGAGVVLYSVSSSVRASASDAKKVEKAIKKAKVDGDLAEEDEVSEQNLEKIGFSKDEAAKYNTSYNVYKSGKVQAQREDVMSGFGNNGGEEFVSFLQTGESMVIGEDSDWKKWFDNISGRLLSIQNTDGSWNGHHCITSPVFCTATCLLILSINNDIEILKSIGNDG